MEIHNEAAASPKDSKQRLRFLGTTLVLLLATAAIILNVQAILVGVTEIDDCKVQPYIPIWLIVAAAIGLAEALTRSALYLLKFWAHTIEDSVVVRVLNVLYLTIAVILLAWSLLGCCWIYGSAHAYFSGEGECSASIFIMAFVFVTLNLIIWILMTSWHTYKHMSRRRKQHSYAQLDAST